jgi:hypothetical protein
MDVSTQLRISCFFSPDPNARSAALRGLDSDTLKQEPFRVAVATLACSDRDNQVREDAGRLYAIINPPASA